MLAFYYLSIYLQAHVYTYLDYVLDFISMCECNRLTDWLIHIPERGVFSAARGVVPVVEKAVWK